MGRAGFARARIGGALEATHTYTRTKRVMVQDDPSTPSVDEAHNLWGADVTQHPSTQVTLGVACAYTDQQRLVRTDNGMLIVRTPTLQVVYTDPLDVGDWVSNVQTLDGTLLLAGPAEVEEMVPVAPTGPVILKNALLRAVRPGI